MSDSNPPPKSSIPLSSSSNSLLRKPGSGIPSRLPAPSSIRKSASNASNNEPYTSSVQSSTTNLSNASVSSLNSQAISQPPQVQQVQQPQPSQSVQQPSQQATTNLTTAPSGSLKNLNKQETEDLKNAVKDLTEKLETLKLKRAEDREKIREFEKFKLQIQQLQEYKTKAQEMISALNKDIQQTKQEAKTIKDEFDSYKEEMSNHEQRLEEMTVDKELAEARVEELQDELSKLSEKHEEVKLELEVLKGEIELNGVEGASNSFQQKQLEKEQETLKAALIKLRDLNIQDKNELNSLRKQNEELNQKILKLSKENENIKTENSSYLAQINELNDQVTATLGSVQIIEQLTERNLDLESKIEELKEEIVDLEAINEVNDQLQENAREEEKELRQNLDIAESRIRESEKQIELLKYSIADHEKTILKFRDLVKQLQSENDNISRQLKTKLEEEKESLNQSLTNPSQLNSNFDFKQKFFEAQIQSKVIENDVNIIELQNLKKYNSFLLSFMSDSFLKQSGNNECLLTLIFFKKISNKCDLLLNHFKEKINKILSNEQSAKGVLNTQLGFFYDLSMFSSKLKLICNKFEYILNNCELKIYSNIGSMYYDFNLNEKNLDSIIDLLQKDQLDENINLDGLDKMALNFQTILKNHLNEEKYDHNIYIEDLVKFALFTAESITLDIYKLNNLTESKDDSSEIILLFKEISCKNDEIKTIVKKLQRNLPDRENPQYKNVLIFPSEFLTQLEYCMENFNLISKTLKELYNLASNSKIFSSSLNDSFEPFSGKKLESLAYQACDKVYLKDDNGPYDNLRNSIQQINNILAKTCSCLENGDFDKELTDEEFKIKKYQVNSPAQKAAEFFKNTLLEAESIKFKLEDKEEEIKELKKNLKLKVDELSEQKLRISLVEKKAETQQKEIDEKNKKLSEQIEEMKSESAKKEKEHSETLEALQQELDSLEKERRELKEKLRKITIFDSIMNRQNSSTSDLYTVSTSDVSKTPSLPVVDSPALIQEIQVLKCQNKLLQKSLNEAKQSYANRLLNQIANNKFDSKEKFVIMNNNQLDEKQKNFVDLSKKTNDLLKDVYSSFANYKIENLENKKTSNNLDLNKLEEKNIYLTVNKIQQKISNLQKDLNFDDYKQINTNDKRKLVAEISLPASCNQKSVVELNINFDEIKELLRNI